MALLVILQQAAQHGATAHATAPGDAGAEEPAPADWLPDLAAQLAQQVCVWGGVRISGPGCTHLWAGVYAAVGRGVLSSGLRSTVTALDHMSTHAPRLTTCPCPALGGPFLRNPLLLPPLPPPSPPPSLVTPPSPP